MTDLLYSIYFTNWTLIETKILFNPFMSSGSERSYILKQTSSWKLQVFLSVYELLLLPSMKGLNRQIITSSSVTTVK